MKKVSLLAMSIATVLSGCGGSDSSSTSAGTTITGQDGYYVNALVFDDIDKDGVLDIGEDTIYGLTNESGQITLPSGTNIQGYLALQVLVAGGDVQNSLINSDSETYTDDTYTIDSDYPDTGLDEEIVLRTSASIDSNTVTAVVNPITDAVAILVANGATQEAAEETIANGLDIDTSELYTDYIASEQNKTHKAAQILASAKASQSNYEVALGSSASSILSEVKDAAGTAVEADEAAANDDDDTNDDDVNVPSLTLSSNGSGGYAAVTIDNIKASVDAKVLNDIQTKLNEIGATEGGSISWNYSNVQNYSVTDSDGIILVYSLFSDNDMGNVPTQDITVDYDGTDESGVTIAISGTGRDTVLTISSNEILTNEDIHFVLKMDDLDANSNPVGTVLSAFTIPVTPVTHSPVVDADVKSSIQDSMDSWALTLDESFSKSFSVGSLFTDEDGDALTYTASNTAGLTVEVSNGLVIISGAPSQSGSGQTLSVTASDGDHETTEKFTLPTIEGDDSDTADSGIQQLLNNTWYVVEHGSDDGDDSTTNYTRIWCDTVRFEDGIVYGNERSIDNLGTCDATADTQWYNGTYTVDGDTLVATFTEDGEEETIVYSLKEDSMPGNSISPGALTVLQTNPAEESGSMDKYELYTYYASQTDAEARIKIDSNAEASDRHFPMWLPAESDDEYQLGSVDVTLTDTENGVEVGDADIYFNPAEGGSITCDDIEEFYYGFSLISKTSNNSDPIQLWGGCIDKTEDDGTQYAVIDFDFDSNENVDLEEGVTYAILATPKSEMSQYIETIKFSLEWTGQGNND